MKIIILAAGVGKRFGKTTEKFPKCLISIGKKGDNLLSRTLGILRALGLKDIVIVVGHQKEKIKKECRKIGKGLGIRFVFNKNYRQGSVVSLFIGLKELNEDCLIMDADVYFPKEALKKLVRSKHRTAFLIDRKSKSSGEEMMLMAKNGLPCAIAKKVDPSLKILGESVGFFKVSRDDAAYLKKILSDFVKRGNVNVEYEDTYNVLMKKRKVGFESMGGFFWTEMDFKEDLQKIRKFLQN